MARVWKGNRRIGRFLQELMTACHSTLDYQTCVLSPQPPQNVFWNRSATAANFSRVDRVYRVAGGFPLATFPARWPGRATPDPTVLDGVLGPVGVRPARIAADCDFLRSLRPLDAGLLVPEPHEESGVSMTHVPGRHAENEPGHDTTGCRLIQGSEAGRGSRAPAHGSGTGQSCAGAGPLHRRDKPTRKDETIRTQAA